MKKRNFWSALTLAFAAAAFTACNDDVPQEENKPTEPVALSGYYILNSGKLGSNNASLSFYDKASKKLTADLFMDQNGRGLGDTANDMVIYGSKIYIAVHGSQVIEVTDLQGKSIKQIKTDAEGKNVMPRYFTTHGGKVYVSLYDGYVAAIDTANLVIDQKAKVGRNPEQLVVAKEKLYVANSGGMDHNTVLGYDKTVSVVDLKSFTETKKIDVVLNPCNLEKDTEDDVYLVSMGNYDDIPNTLQRIDTDKDEVKTIGNATKMASLGDKIFMLYSQYDKDWNQTINYPMFNALEEEFISDNCLKTEVSKPYEIAADKATNQLFVTTSDYSNNGDVYIFDTDGNLQTQFEAGLNPIAIVASSNQ